MCPKRARPTTRAGHRQPDVNPAPGFVVDDPPPVTTSGRVLGQQDVAGRDREPLAAPGLELERPAQRDHILAPGALCHVEARSRRALLKAHRVAASAAAARVGGVQRAEVDAALGEFAIRRRHRCRGAPIGSSSGSGSAQPASLQPVEPSAFAKVASAALVASRSPRLSGANAIGEPFVGRGSPARTARSGRSFTSAGRDGQELHEGADTSGRQVVERVQDPAVRVVPDAGDGALRCFNSLATMSEVFPIWIPTT